MSFLSGFTRALSENRSLANGELARLRVPQDRAGDVTVGPTPRTGAPVHRTVSKRHAHQRNRDAYSADDRVAGPGSGPTSGGVPIRSPRPPLGQWRDRPSSIRTRLRRIQ